MAQKGFVEAHERLSPSNVGNARLHKHGGASWENREPSGEKTQAYPVDLKGTVIAVSVF